jgi:hypothetical protein
MYPAAPGGGKEVEHFFFSRQLHARCAAASAAASEPYARSRPCVRRKCRVNGGCCCVAGNSTHLVRLLCRRRRAVHEQLKQATRVSM